MRVYYVDSKLPQSHREEQEVDVVLPDIKFQTVTAAFVP